MHHTSIYVYTNTVNYEKLLYNTYISDRASDELKIQDTEMNEVSKNQKYETKDC